MMKWLIIHYNKIIIENFILLEFDNKYYRHIHIHKWHLTWHIHHLHVLFERNKTYNLLEPGLHIHVKYIFVFIKQILKLKSIRYS